MMTSDDIELTGYLPGALGRITELHGAYSAAHWDLGLYFEARLLQNCRFSQSLRSRPRWCLVCESEGGIIGGIFIDGGDADGEGARLRWFIIDPAYQGRGVGNRLMTEAISFCRRQHFKRVFLTTFAGLNTARHLYEKFGFRLCHEEDGSHLTGKSSLVEQVFELILPGDSDPLT
jgi:GNAT superfamily N-acetyltransferase